jgi:hypothetical protein
MVIEKVSGDAADSRDVVGGASGGKRSSGGGEIERSGISGVEWSGSAGRGREGQLGALEGPREIPRCTKKASLTPLASGRVRDDLQKQLLDEPFPGLYYLEDKSASMKRALDFMQSG